TSVADCFPKSCQLMSLRYLTGSPLPTFLWVKSRSTASAAESDSPVFFKITLTMVVVCLGPLFMALSYHCIPSQ
ncbi:hypothetical protein, partial [Pseudoalteromonas piscicida]|uniref:hypothetical protein n=1 Tax=Pseudoalteromonas piscicida TaxID=43662 RepID=UPI001B7FD000